MNGHQPKVADAVLGSESSAREIADHANLVFWQIENFRGFVTNACGELRGGVNGQTVLLAVRHDPVRLQGHTRLDRSLEFAFDDHVRFGESRVDVPARPPNPSTGIRSTHVSL